MNKYIKQLIGVAAVAIALCATQSFGQPNSGGSPTPALSTNYTYTWNGTGANGNAILITNPCKIAQIQVLSDALGQVIGVYDNSVTNQTYTNQVFVTRTEVQSNMVITSVSPLTGITNIETNTVWTENVTTNSSTNTLLNLPQRYFAAGPSSMATYPVNMIMAKGVALSLTKGTNVSVIITYRIND